MTPVAVPSSSLPWPNQKLAPYRNGQWGLHVEVIGSKDYQIVTHGRTRDILQRTQIVRIDLNLIKDIEQQLSGKDQNGSED